MTTRAPAVLKSRGRKISSITIVLGRNYSFQLCRTIPNLSRNWKKKSSKITHQMKTMLTKIMETIATTEMIAKMADSIRASHANHVNRNQSSCCGTHKSLWNREICDQKKERNREIWSREMCRRKRGKYEFLNQRNMRWKSFECTVGKPLFFRAGRRAQSSPAGQPEAISSKCNPMKYCAPSPPPPLSLFSCCEIKYVSEERAMGPRNISW